MKQKLIILLSLVSLAFSDYINMMLDSPSYIMTSDDSGTKEYNHAFISPGISLGYKTNLYSKNLFTFDIGGEFMMGRKSDNKDAIFAFHTLYLSPSFIIGKRLNVFTKFGYSLINTDTDKNLFDYPVSYQLKIVLMDVLL